MSSAIGQHHEALLGLLLDTAKAGKIRHRELAPDVIVLQFPDEAAWLAARRLVVTASDVAAVLGMDPSRSRYSVWQEKVDQESREFRPDMQESLLWGRILEEAIAGELKRRLGRQFTDLGRWTLVVNLKLEAPLAASLDYVIEPDIGVWKPLETVANTWMWQATRAEPTELSDLIQSRPALRDPRGRGVAEIKNVNEFLGREEWEGEGPVPKIVQLQTHLAVTTFQWGVLAGLAGGRKLIERHHTRDEEFIAWMVDQVRRFMWHVQTRTEPPVDEMPSTEAALGRHYKRGGLGEIELPPAALTWAFDLETAEDRKTSAEKEIRLLRNRIKQAIGHHDVGTLPASEGRRGFRWSTVRSSKTECPKCSTTVSEKAAHRRLQAFPKRQKEGEDSADADGPG